MKLVCVFAYRYDSDFIEDMKKNLPFVDEFIEYDDRSRTTTWYHEGKVRNSLINRAKDAKADWILCMDPDERLEKNAGKIITGIIHGNIKSKYYYARVLEMFSPTEYRVDSIWGRKKKVILFPNMPGQRFESKELHSPWSPIGYGKQELDLNLYHLKMIKPADREIRRKVFNKVDHKRIYQKIGYDYLIDEHGMVLRSIPKGREYYPEYRDYRYDIIE